VGDVFDSLKRSEVMSRIRGKGNRSTELPLASAFRRARITGWRRHLVLKLKVKSKHRAAAAAAAAVLVTRPDFVFKKERVAVFVDGCFWHQCPLHSKVPENNRAFWKVKLARNVERDRQTNAALRSLGWVTMRYWEHELSNPDRVARKVARRMAALPGK
jgi:DNA mismatch endonuclease (patch repair protein)